VKQCQQNDVNKVEAAVKIKRGLDSRVADCSAVRFKDFKGA
jgi:hypothetical protein